ncbi:MAG: helix-turn-helix domain-containing protein [Geobacteraceae bacterium]|nr:helix-turn-helix domain-containing protein [Geobacteraceae bacterium]
MRDLKIGIKPLAESNKEMAALFDQFDKGVFPEQPIERVYFHDFKTLLQYITPKRLVLLEVLHATGAMSVNALAKLLKRSYANVHEDVRVLESVGLIERDSFKRICVPWNEIDTTLKLAV